MIPEGLEKALEHLQQARLELALVGHDDAAQEVADLIDRLDHGLL